MKYQVGVGLLCVAWAIAPVGAQSPERKAYFGDLHVHTNLSFDAHIFGNENGPDEAYRYAKGEALNHPGGFKMQLRRPLDFLAVTDHGMYLGMLPAMVDPQSSVGQHSLSKRMQQAKSVIERMSAFRAMFTRLGRTPDMPPDDLLDLDIVSSTWRDINAATERHNDPGRFTAFHGYEYTSGPEFRNLHRNVIFAGTRTPDRPFSRLDSSNPEDLWDWMDGLRAEGIEALAIPHNSNGSDGIMFAMDDYGGAPLTPAYVRQRMRNEPLAEISQVKGTSETHPMLSPNDEWANFEIMNYRIATWLPSRPMGSYLRDAWLSGLKLEADGKGNPYQFGVISSSDTHVGAGSFREDNYWSKVGLVDADGLLRGSVRLKWYERLLAGWQSWRLGQGNADNLPDTGSPPDSMFAPYVSTFFSDWAAAGLAGIWAEDNTRAALYAAMRRKETFGTSGPRLRVRLFAGYNYPSNVMQRADMVQQGYARGVPMGGELRGQRASPQFIVWAAQDSLSAPLQRLQIVKGWLAGNRVQEKVYDVACADGQPPDPNTYRCRDNGAQVNLSDCSYTADSGAAELKTLWQDPDYVEGQTAFYYIRALENPTCRWSTWDAIRANSPRNPRLAATVQERVWSSPIWVKF